MTCALQTTRAGHLNEDPLNVFSPPVFPSAQDTARARLLHSIVWTTVLITGVAEIAISIVQPALVMRNALVVADLILLGVVLLALSRRGKVELACILWVA